MLEEQLAVITGLWETGEGEPFSHAGEHYTLTDSPALPKPVQRPRPPVLVGGKGKRRTPALAAEFADEFNLPFVSLEVTSAQFGRVRKACEDIGRDPDELTYSNALVLCCGATEADVRRRADAIGRDVDDLRATALGGHSCRGGGPDRPVRGAGVRAHLPADPRPRRPRPHRAGRE